MIKTMNEFKVQRICMLMEPEPGNELEVEGVLNPAAVRGQDGELYLFPRLVAKGNFSRIGIAKVKFNESGDPIGVERLGIAIEPTESYELRPGGGGCEDPRISFVKPLGHYVMTYVAFGPNGPRIAVARSNDLINWEKRGLATFDPYKNLEFQGIDNKDSAVFPELILSPEKDMKYAILHRPLFPGTRPEDLAKAPDEREMDDRKESIWISYRPIDDANHTVIQSSRFTSHFHLALPQFDWEKLKIGCGAPPVMTKLGWMLIYHGVSKADVEGDDEKKKLTYSAGVMILSKDNPCEIIYRSADPIMKPELAQEAVGLVANVVFPTGIDRRDDIGMPDRFDIYYGMADDRIGVARLDIPDELPAK
jgi:predicted GH43/DUF377 family glycosyl hydrolase